VKTIQSLRKKNITACRTGHQATNFGVLFQILSQHNTLPRKSLCLTARKTRKLAMLVAVTSYNDNVYNDNQAQLFCRIV